MFRRNIGTNHFFYRWDDGWTACVTTTRVSCAEAKKLDRKSKGFCGYDWMIASIIRHGAIGTEREMDKYGYIGIETLLNYCENSKNHAVTPNEFMRMNRVRMAEPHWIPCSERLPEFKYETYDKEDDFTYWDTDVVMGSTNIGMLTLGVFCCDSNHPNEYHWDSIEAGRPFDMCGLAVGVHVIAWMPLPKPYTEDKE